MDFQKYDDIFDRENYPVFEVTNGKCKPVDDKPCICLSGKKYKDCCKKEITIALSKEISIEDAKKITELYYQKENKLLSHKIVEKAIDKKNISYCSAEKIFGNCDKKHFNVKSHTLSRGNVLKNLAGNGNESVIAFNDHIVPDADKVINDINQYYKDTLLKDASVTVSFCKEHDKKLFSDIETDGSTEYKNCDIQNLEYALKSVSFDIYYKLENIRYLSQLVKTNKNVVSSYDGNTLHFLDDYNVTLTILFALYPQMQEILTEIKNLMVNGIPPTLRTVCFDLPVSKINFSCSEVIDEADNYYFINVVNSSKPYIIFSYYSNGNGYNWIENKKLNYINSTKKIDFLYDFVLSFFFCNAQNIFFNKDAFDALSDEEKRYLYVIHREGTANIPDSVHDNYFNSFLKFVFTK